MSSTENTDDFIDTDGPWRKLPITAILFFIVKAIFSAVRSAFQILLGGVAAYKFLDEDLFSFVFVLPLLSFFILIQPLAQYFSFRFRFTEDAFQVKSGIFSRKRLTLAFDRIQNTNIAEPIYYRPFGLVNLNLESAGSADEEVVLPGIRAGDAREIKAVILDAREEKPQIASETLGITEALSAQRYIRSSIEANSPPAPDEGSLYIHRSIGELARYGISNNQPLIILGIVSATFWQFYDNAIFAGVKNAVDGLTQNAQNMAASAPALLWLGAALLVGFVALVLLGFGVLGAILKHYDYKLAGGPARLTRVEGFFEKNETHLPRRKIQSVAFHQPVIARLLNRYHVKIRQISHQNLEDGKIKDKSLIVPSLTPDLSEELAADIFSVKGLMRAHLKGIHIQYLWKTLAFNFAGPSVIAAGIITTIFGPVGLLPLLLPVIMAPIVELRRRRYGYHMTDKHMVIQQGFFGIKRVLFEHRKIQYVRITRSPGQRQSKLASIEFHLAGNSILLPYIPLEEAEYFREKCLYATRINQVSWM